ncbi:MAG: tetratricopeptide repeat protein [Lewinella sp.]|nr:tetratricopeptide repeat protein [Lewinella sp.]
MAKRKKKQARPSIAPASFRLITQLGWYLGLSLLTLLVYWPSLQNGFVNWDDQLYVTENPLIWDLAGNFPRILTDPVAGNHHPLTVLSLALDYQLAGLDPFQYHLTNLLLHLLNTGLVFAFMYRLADRQALVAGVTALFFALHPMHVESVAWVSGRKDLLYTLFFLLSLLAYLRYLQRLSWGWLGGSLLLFVLSVAAKPAAVVLPVVLLLVDYARGRDWQWRWLWEKVPFFLVSLVFGWLTIQAQQAGGAVGDLESYTIGQRLLFGCYGLMMYLYKAIIPYPLTNLYAYPDLAEGLPFAYYLGPFVVAAAAALLVYFRRNRLVVFAALFFVVSLLLVLQLVTVGSAIMADRYTYVPYIGLGLLVGLAASYLHQRWPGGKIPLLALGVLITGLFAYLSWRQVQVWQDGESLWLHAIAVEPISRNYASLADYHKRQGDYEQALARFTEAINLRPGKYDHWGDRGTTYFQMGNYAAAIQDFQQALQLKPDAAKVHRNMGSALGAAGRYQEALGYFNRALELEPALYGALEDRGSLYIYLQQYDLALQDFQAYLASKPLRPSGKTLNGLGIVYYYKGDYATALTYYDQAIAAAPNDGQTYLNRAVCHSVLGNRAQASADAQRAQQLGMQVDPALLQQLNQ